MKVLRFCSLVFLVSLLIVSFVTNSWASAMWPKKKGKLCWEVNNNQTGLVGTCTLQITNMGDNHYSLHGRLTEKDGKVVPIVGSAEIEGNSILMILTNAGGNGTDTMFTRTLSVTLDKSTLDGTHQLIVHNYSNSSVGHGYTTGTDTLISCQ